MKNKLLKSILFLFTVATIALLVAHFGWGYPQPAGRYTINNYTLTGTDTLQYDSISLDQTTAFEFENNSVSEPVTFWFNHINEANYHSAKDMLASVIRPDMTDEEKSRAIWKLVSLSGFHYPFDYNSQLKDNINPLALVRFPYFMCGEKAGIFTSLATLACLKARAVYLDGHVVAETFYNQAWHLFDADENCVFKNPQGQIASAEDLHRHPDWINEQQIESASTDEFHGMRVYKTRFTHYEYWMADTVCVLPPFEYQNSSVTLYPQDKVSFILSPTQLYTRIWHPRFLLNSGGKLIRRLDRAHGNIQQVNDTVFVLKRDFPYYITQITISADAPVNTRIYLETRNRETNAVQRKFLGLLTERKKVIKNMDAPQSANIYYNYRLWFENLHPNDIDNITVEQDFDFNSITFPMHKRGAKIIHCDSIAPGESISFQIVKGTL